MSTSSVLRSRLSALFAVVLGLALVPAVASADHITTHPTDSACANAPEDEFVDTGTEGSAQEEAVDCIAWYSITGGTTQTTYSPTLPISRMQMATMIAEAMRQSEPEFAEPGPNEDFFDDDEGSNHEHNINFVAKHGVVKGLGDDKYGPTQSVTRAQMASFLVNLLRAVGAELPQPSQDYFDDDNDSVHEGNINILAELGLATGRTHRGYEPGTPVTRGQMALFISRTLDEMVDQNLLVPPGQAGAVTVTLNQTSVPQGGELTGSITSSEQTVKSATVSGCGLNGQSLSDRDANAEGIQFQTTIPVTQPVGQCQLTFNVTLDDDSTATAQLTITVTAIRTVTDAPELISVSLVDESSTTVELRYTFDEDIEAGVSPAGFRIYSFTAEQFEAEDASREGSNSVVATFSDEEYEQATAATVVHGAVHDGEGTLNPEGSVPLRGLSLEAGETSAPDLVGVDDIDQSSANVTADFLFDEEASTAFSAEETSSTTDEPRFHLILDDGTRLDGEPDDTTPNDDRVTVRFPRGDADIDEEPVRRAYVDKDAVRDEDGNWNPAQSVDVSDGGDTDLPDLVDITIDEANDEITYRFDEPVDPVPAPSFPRSDQRHLLFQLYRLGGAQEEAQDVDDGDTSFTVIAKFKAGSVDATVVGASVDEDAVRATRTGNPTNRFDEQGVARNISAGRTTAPDLLTTDKSSEQGPLTTTNLVFTFTFDQAVAEDDSTGEGRFVVYTEDGRRQALPEGDLQSGCEKDDEDPKKVVCKVNSQESSDAYNVAKDAVLGAVEHGAVRDENDTDNNDNKNYESSAPFPE